MKLRHYQEQAKNHAIEMLSERGNSLIVAGTGAGKTIMMAAVINDFFSGFTAAHGRKPHILVLVHRTEIHNQNKEKFQLVSPDIAVSEITAQRKSLKGHVHFGMVQTVAKAMPGITKAGLFFDMVVIDEAHHAAASTYEDIIEQNKKLNPSAALLGVTATPNRGDALPLVHLFDNYYQITVKYLIESHFLVSPRFLDLSPVFDTEEGEVKGHLSKYCRSDAEGNALIEKLCKEYLQAKEPGKTVIFTPSHAFCRKIYDCLKSLGRNPSYLSPGIDSVTRLSELDRFENGDSEELINVDICTEGYDYPELRNLVDFDTNGTHGQWVQKVGRVLRTSPGKTSCTVIDFGGNIEMYPEGIESSVNLDGALKKEPGIRLTDDDFFSSPSEPKEHFTENVSYYDDKEYTPYSLPKGFESANDSDYGIVFISCRKKCDSIIVPKGENYFLFYGNKTELHKEHTGTFDECVRKAESLMESEEYFEDDKPISRMQIKLLAPEYPTMALDWYGANCHICWKAWKNVIKELIPS